MPNKRTGPDYLDRKPKKLQVVRVKVDGGTAAGGRTTKKRAEQIRNATPKLEQRKTTPKKNTRWSGSSLTPTQQRQVELQEKRDEMWKEKMRKKYSTKKKK
jgi:hypothetical protein